MRIGRLFKFNQAFGWTAGFFLLVAIDQFTKRLPKLVFLNDRFAFSLPLPAWAMYVIYAAVLGGSIWYVAQRRQALSTRQKLAWLLVWAGALSNIGERLVLGHVRDWIYVLEGVFNLADGYILLGIVILLLFDPQKSPERRQA